MIDMTYWCESCARKNNCYTIRSKPKCFTPITSNDRTTDRKTEQENCEGCRDGDCWGCPLVKQAGPQTITIEGKMPLNEWRKICPENPQFKDEPQTAECPFDDSIPCEWVCTEYGKCKYKPKDEPQTDCSWK